MSRLLYAVVLGLVGAGIVHIVVVLLVPAFSDRDAWSRLAENSGPYRMTRIDASDSGEPLLGAMDPMFAVAACRFDLGDGVVQIASEGHVPFWSASVYDRAGRNVYSFNDHAAPAGNMDFVVLNHAQMLELRKQPSEADQNLLFVETEIDEGIVVIRAFAPDASWRPLVGAFVSNATCDLR
jgi:uncharacterized membrane protein